MPRRTVIFLPLILICLGLAGFAGYVTRPRTGTIHGTVTLDGQPLASGSVLLESAVLRWATIGVVRNGHFQITDIPLGLAHAGVTGQKVPPQYENPTTAGMPITVRRGPQPFTIELLSRH
ncbi:MAG: hypothetical protein LC104_15170 [Bacteroidales bacterium]|nr:hypothetical protein [Bacteroidales bacterium]